MKLILANLLSLIILLPGVATAHGLETTQRQTVGNYIIEFEYNTVGSVMAGDYTLYNVYLLDAKTENGLDYDSAFIRVDKQNGPAIFSGNLAESKDSAGYASMSGIVADPGTYTADVSFYKDGKTLAEAAYNFQVEANNYQSSTGSNKFNWFPGALFVLGFILGLILMTLFKWPKKN